MSHHRLVVCAARADQPCVCAIDCEWLESARDSRRGCAINAGTASRRLRVKVGSEPVNDAPRQAPDVDAMTHGRPKHGTLPRFESHTTTTCGSIFGFDRLESAATGAIANPPWIHQCASEQIKIMNVGQRDWTRCVKSGIF